MSAATSVADLEGRGVRRVRLQFPDLHGVVRGRELPVGELERLAEEGAPFVEATMTIDLRHNIVAGFEQGFRDIVARPDLATLAILPWAPEVAACLCDLETMQGEPFEVDARGALRRAVARYDEIGLHPVVGPELEFYLCRPDVASPWGYRRYEDVPSRVYTNDPAGDPERLLGGMLDSCVAYELGAFAANHEYGRGQFEINLRHGDALDAADRAFRFKAAIKELAAMRGLLATFIGKPWNDDEGSGFHLHSSLRDRAGENAFHDPDGADGVSDACRHFVAGLVAHGPALMAVLCPTTNAYRRITPEALVPTRANWGHDNRFTLVRLPGERGHACRAELRLGDGAANVYLATAAALVAGLDGIQRRLDPPEPVAGLIYELDDDALGAPLPASFGEALDALEADTALADGLGSTLVGTFVEIKRHELERARVAVTDWEFAEYALAL